MMEWLDEDPVLPEPKLESGDIELVNFYLDEGLKRAWLAQRWPQYTVVSRRLVDMGVKWPDWADVAVYWLSDGCRLAMKCGQDEAVYITTGGYGPEGADTPILRLERLEI